MRTAILLTVFAFGLTVKAQNSEYVTRQGQLKIGKTESVIIYLSEETDELWGFCFRNKSAAGRAILAKCRNGEECEFTGKVNSNLNCAPEEGVNGNARIISVKSVRKIANRK